jgi:TfoX/Sxy family transcriptional regulator of competence genes
LEEEDMPYNEELDARIKKMGSRWKNTTNKKMFGGVCHLINGNMFCGVHKDFLILRLGEETSREALASRHVREFDITGKPMKGWVMVDRPGYKSDRDLRDWLEKAKKFAKTLPTK